MLLTCGQYVFIKKKKVSNLQKNNHPVSILVRSLTHFKSLKLLMSTGEALCLIWSSGLRSMGCLKT